MWDFPSSNTVQRPSCIGAQDIVAHPV